MVEYVLGDAPYDESYWQTLLNEGEYSRQTAPPLDPEIIWSGLGMAIERIAPPPPPPPPDNEWGFALQAMENATVLELPVCGYNRGGLLVEWNGRQGFIPISHIAGLPTIMDEEQREAELQARLGCVLRLHVIEVDPERSRLVLSERATRSDEHHRRTLLDSLKIGEIRRGRVTNLCSFGAFVDLGGLEGLVHISEVSWSRVDHPSDALRVGQEVNVYVLNVDQGRGRVGLSVKRAQPDPWQTVEERYRVGQVIQGTITNVVDFGAFAQVDEGLEGLIHVSELAAGDFAHPRNVVQEGQVVQLRVIAVDATHRRLGLSLRQAARPDQEL